MNEKYKGILYIIASAFFFALMAAFVRLAGDLPGVQKSFFRNLIAMIFALVMLLKNKENLQIGKGNLKYLLLRSFCGTVGILANFYAIDKINLADASILNKMSPFFVIIFSIIILKEKIKPLQAAIVILAFLGALMVVKPGFGSFSAASLIGLLGGIAAGAAYTFVRLLKQKGVSSPLIVFFFSAFSCITILPFMLAQYKEMSIIQFVYLIGAGLAATGGQFTITAAYSHAPAREISVYDYTQIIFSTAFGFFLFGEMPDTLSFIGYAVIIAAAIIMFLYNNRKEKV